MIKLKKDIFVAYISHFLILSSSILFFLIISNQISVEDYGLYQRYNSWILFSGFFLSFGFESVLLRFSPDLKKKFFKEFNFFTIQMLLIRISVIIAFYFIAKLILSNRIVDFELLLFLILLFSQVRTLISHYFLAISDLLFERIINSSLSVLKLLFVLILIDNLDVKLIFYIILYSELLILFLYSLKLLINKAYVVKRNKLKEKSKILKFGYQNYLNRLVNNLYEISFFVILIDFFELGLTELSFFAFSYVILNILYTLNLFTILEQHLAVYLKKMYNNSIKDFKLKINLLSRSSIIIQMFILIFSISFIQDFLYFVYEEKFIDSIKYFEIGIVLVFVKSINSTFTPFIYLEEDIRIQNKLTFIHLFLLPGIVLYIYIFSIIGIFYYLILFYLVLILYQTNYSYRVFNYRPLVINQVICLLVLFIFLTVYSININEYDLLKKIQFMIAFYLFVSLLIVKSKFLSYNEIIFLFKTIFKSNKK